MSMAPVCYRCKLMYGKVKNGVPIEEGRPNADGTWSSYQLWMGDLWKCEGCGAEVLIGFGVAPIAEHYQPEYAAMLAKFGNPPRVDDCPHLYRGAR